MSTRNVRKLAEKLQQASRDRAGETEEQEDVYFEPLYAGKLASAYKGLVISSSTSEADDSSNEYKSSSDEAPVVEETQKKKNKNNRKKRNKNKNRHDSAEQSDNDEIAKVVAEVNQLLGEPEVPEPEPEPEPVPEASLALLKINHKHLNIHNELFRMFGPDENEGRGKRRPNTRHRRRQIIFTNESYSFTARGLSMTLLEITDGVKYFKFEHGPEYQKNMHTLVKAMKLHYDSFIRARDYEVYPTKTVEALIQNLDLYFVLDENSIATNALEQALYFMQSVFDPAFNYLDGKTRLEYQHVENRAFHIALLKYLHILTNKACHRTALELAKLMLNLDPTDPLGVIFIMDTLALRAREHSWLVDIYAQWAVEKDATRLFHLRYSHALAVHHLYLKNKKPEDLVKSNNLIKYALVKYPNVAVMIMGLCKHENPEIMNHELFTTLANKSTSADLKNLQFLYAKFVWPKWREANLMSWVTANALEILARYKDEPEMRQRVKTGTEERSRLFRKYPIEIKRHLSTISSMSNLLVEGAVPVMEKTCSFNPYPTQGRCIDVHRYFKEWGQLPQERLTPIRRGIIRSFIASLAPGGTGSGARPRNDGA